MLHNTKVDKIQKGFRELQEKKANAKEQGITLKELEDQENNNVIDVKFPKAKKAKKDNFEIVIKMKDENGEIQNFEAEKPKKKEKIEAEETLDMIEKALGVAPTKKKTTKKKATINKKKEEISAE